MLENRLIFMMCCLVNLDTINLEMITSISINFIKSILATIKLRLHCQVSAVTLLKFMNGIHWFVARQLNCG